MFKRKHQTDSSPVVAGLRDNRLGRISAVSSVSVGSNVHSQSCAAPAHTSKVRDAVLLLSLTLGALLVHGYHPAAEDAEIYLPGIEKVLQPELFGFNAQFFQSHAHLTLFPDLIATSVKISHVPLEVGAFVWQLLSMFLLLLGCWELSGRCFSDRRARWAGVALVAALFTLPVAGTALYIMDQYINPRNLAAFAGIFIIVAVLDRRYLWAGLFLLFGAAMHPLMPAFTMSYAALLVWMRRREIGIAGLAGALPLASMFSGASPAYHEVAASHSYHYFLRWQWYEIAGAVAPLAILWWFRRIARSRQMRNVDLLCRAALVYEAICIVAAVLLSSSPRFETLARVQPMRSLHLVYVLMLLLAGGFVGEFVLKNHAWRWLTLFLPLSLGMFCAQCQLFAASAHIEWPGAIPRNPWVQAFLWIRNTTPVDAVFALDPDYMNIPGEDANGFRAIAERSMLADAVKDSGAVSMFPPLAGEWLRQVDAQRGWRNFQPADYHRLQTEFGVNWVVVQKPVSGLDCPYQNTAVSVCRLDSSDSVATRLYP